MKSVFKKGFTFILAVVAAIASTTALAGCGPRGEAIDPTKTQIHVSNYNGGWGTDWLYAAKDRFTELVKEISFEDGKTGVQIHVNPNRDEVGTNIQAGTDNIYFSQDIRLNDRVGRRGDGKSRRQAGRRSKSGFDRVGRQILRVAA